MPADTHAHRLRRADGQTPLQGSGSGSGERDLLQRAASRPRAFLLAFCEEATEHMMLPRGQAPPTSRGGASEGMRSRTDRLNRKFKRVVLHISHNITIRFLTNWFILIIENTKLEKKIAQPSGQQAH